MTRLKILRKRDKIIELLNAFMQSALIEGNLTLQNTSDGAMNYIHFVNNKTDMVTDRELVYAFFFRLAKVVNVTWCIENKDESIKDIDVVKAVNILIQDLATKVFQHKEAMVILRNDFRDYKAKNKEMEQETSIEEVRTDTDGAEQNTNS